MQKLLPFNLLFLFFLIPTFIFTSPLFDHVKIAKVLEKEENTLKISKIIYIKSEDRPFTQTYWKIYFNKDKIVAEELYQDNKLVYYYTYYYTKNKIYQKGFYWHGIYYDIKYFKAHDKLIKQGWMYKNYPETYSVYDAKSLKKTYSHYYKDFES